MALTIALILLLHAVGAELIVKGSWEYKDLISILLTVVSVIVTFVGIIIAIAAIWGFQTLKTMAEEKAVETSKLGSEAFLKSPEFQTIINTRIQTAIEASARDAVQDALAPLIVRNDDGASEGNGEQEWVD
ncbi:hypothetical protein F7D01_00710 [Erythrobacter sp. 3-20A1M]|uniref:hypothetical protein n=1 Tax=Erythrobacter sp. 3-20A1M TaxID=2653850 RepID=UPI001BFCBC8A|nr:hypothetical protein [Erythrobacter sp. 3-20A1M]QWC55802.1 hypothetical protein F7D01_00710 [Erythrobacter sp. 3-20A1M]